jgi:Transcription factor WhiB
LPEIRARHVAEDLGQSTGLPKLADLIPSWHRDAACNGEGDENLFFFEPTAVAYQPHAASASLLLPMLICARCPVRVECLRSSLEQIVIPGRVWQRGEHREKVMEDELPRTMGVWGGATEHDRMQTKDLPTDARVEVLERTLQRRIEQRSSAQLRCVSSGTDESFTATLYPA